MTAQNRDELLQKAKNLGLIIYAFSPIYLKGPNGADFSVSIDFLSHGQQAGFLAKRFLANPVTPIPVERPNAVKIYIKKGRQGLNTEVPEANFVP